MLSALAARWWIPLVKGLVMILFGLLAISAPAFTLWTLIVAWGAIALVDGVTSIFMGFGGGTERHRWWEMILLGLLGVAAGLVAFAWPGLTLTVFILLIAWWAIFHGLFEIFAAIKLRKFIDDEWVLIFSGLLAVVFGALLLWRPTIGAEALMLLAGWYLLFLGILSVVLAFRLHSFRRHHVATA